MNDTAASIQAWLISRLASQLQLNPADIDVRASFSRYGLDSAGATALMAQLSVELGRPLSATLLWQYTTVEELAQGLANGGPAAAASGPTRATTTADEPIAVVGLACRFPGASNVEAFWRMLCEGRDAIREVPPDRWDLARFYDADPTVPGKVCTRRGGFLDRLDQFDPLFFGISPREAIDMDPQQRLMLELSWEALEDAGVPPPSLKGSRTAVFVGTVCRDYALTRTNQLESLTQHSGTGHSNPIIANRVSYALGLQGPSLVVDTACSSALVAAHLACQSLRAGEATLALVGGSNLLLSLDIMVAASKFGGLSPDGCCKSFDARADGYGRGEGAGVVVLKPLSQALAQGDSIYCVIRGSAVNNDGASNGMTAPNPLAQVSVLRDAYAQAGRAPRGVHYVEAHGTGTPLGDPIEAKALSAVLCEGRPADRPLRIGSVKTNIGHLEGGAGIAGIIKLALALKRRVLPPSLNFETPNPHIQFEALNLKVQTRLEPWPADETPALAGVSSFGWGGTNAHAVLEALEPQPTCLFPLAADDPEALRSVASEWAASLASDDASAWSLEALCATAASRLSPGIHRLAIAAQSRGQVLEQLRAHLEGRSRPGLFRGVAGAPRKLAFVFAPHGAYWCGMGRQLMADEPVFRATVERVDRAFKRLSGTSIIEELNLEEKRSRLHLARVMQPVLFAMQVALVELLRSWGIEPDAVVGHSIGEMMAAHVAGALQFDDAIWLLHHVSRGWGTMEGQGGMAAIRMSKARLEETLAPYQGKLTISGYYSPKMTSVSGDVSLLDELLTTKGAAGKGAVLAHVNAAAHSPWVEDMSRELRASLDGLRTKRATIPLVSTVTGDHVEGGELDASYWARNVREPVRFCQAIERLAEDGCDCFLEISPVPSLVPWIRETLSSVGRKGVVLSSLQRGAPERSTLIESLGALYTLGRPVRFDRLLPGDAGRVPPPAGVGSEHGTSAPRAAPASVELLPLSARDPEALRGLAASMRSFVADHGDEVLRDACSTAMLHRAHHEHRLVVTGRTAEEVGARLDSFVRGERATGVSSGRCQPGRMEKVAFVFSGNGSQWPRMGSSLFAREPVFREAIERCAASLGRYTDWSIIDELQADEERSRLGRARLSQLEVQPCIFAVQVALAALWRSWGIEPAAVVGHSVGEVAAAHVSGALSLEDAARIICRRGQLAARTSGQGGMALVELPLDLARAAIAGHEHELSIAAANGPRTTLLSGAPAALEEVLAALERQGVFCRLVKIDYAPHSAQMDALRGDFLAALEGIRSQRGTVPLYSTVTGEVEDGLGLGADYWARNLRDPVLFHPMTKRLLADGYRVFLEVSPHPVLVPALEETLRQSGEGSVALPSLRRSEDERGSLLGSAGVLYTLGCPLEWRAIQPEGGRSIRLPTYPFQRERFWPEPAKVSRRRGGASGHPLLGSHVRLSDPPDTHLWETELALDEIPYLRDHRVGDVAVLPATAYVELALAAAGEALGDGPHVVKDVSLRQMLSLPEDGSRVVQVMLSASGRGAASFRVFSRSSEDAASNGGWVLHAEGSIRSGAGAADAAPARSSIAALEARCGTLLSADEHYRVTASIGLPYGPQFRGVVELRCGDREALARVRPTDAVRAQAQAYRVHPALLDACLQGILTLAVGPEPERPSAYLPVSIGQTTLHATPPASEALRCHLVLRQTGEGAETFEGEARVLREDGALVLEMLGIGLRRIEPRAADQLSDWLYETSWDRQVAPPASLEAATATPASWLLFADRGGVADGLGVLLEKAGHRAVLVSPGASYRAAGATRFELDPARPEDFDRLLVEALPAGTPSCRHLVHLHTLDTSPLAVSNAASLKAEQPLASAGLLHLVQAVSRASLPEAPRLALVTRGARSVDGADAVALEQAPIWGLARAISHEHPELGCRCVDLDPVASADDAGALLAELRATDGEEQVALRAGARHVARLLQRSKAPARAPQEPPVSPAGERPFRLELASVGVLDRLRLRGTRRTPPGRGEVEIEVAAAGLNFLDVLLALGVIPDDQPGGPHLGGECAGTIAAVGEGVTDFAPGQRVMAVAPSSFATHVATSSLLVAPIPEGVSFEEAATIPIVFLTAYQALVRVGRLAKGERVLIHAGAGGVGLAAVQIAQHVGAEIFATAGSPEKREFLRSLGVQHVFDSRSLAFAAEIRQATHGEGVDVVLNSLAGEFIPTSFGLLRGYGRFVEIGKRDYYEDRRLGLKPFLNNLTFSLVDLRGMSQERPALIAELLREVGPLFASGALKPLVRRIFPIVEAKAAFRCLAQAKHIGKIVVSLEGRAQTPILEAERERGFRADATYLVTGGLGGIGVEVVRWMVAEGARHVAIMSRRGAASPQALRELEHSGARIRVLQADVGDEASVARALAELEGAMPPLRGIVHSAAILEDGTLLRLTQEQLWAVMAPKALGAWNLHRLTLGKELDFFVLFSSVAAVLGSPGQANYCAANAFLDALAHDRRRLGLPGLSLQWGPWNRVGLAARAANRGERLDARGVDGLEPEQGIAALARLVHDESPELAIMSFDFGRWRQFYPKVARSPLFSRLGCRGGEEAEASAQPSLRAMLLAAEPSRRQELLEAAILEQVALVARVPASRIDATAALATLGLDSLMALELRNRLEATLGVSLPSTLVWTYPTIRRMGPPLAAMLGIALEEPTPGARPEPAPPADSMTAASAIEGFSDERAEALLQAELEDLARAKSHPRGTAT